MNFIAQGLFDRNSFSIKSDRGAWDRRGQVERLRKNKTVARGTSSDNDLRGNAGAVWRPSDAGTGRPQSAGGERQPGIGGRPSLVNGVARRLSDAAGLTGQPGYDESAARPDHHESAARPNHQAEAERFPSADSSEGSAGSGCNVLGGGKSERTPDRGRDQDTAETKCRQYPKPGGHGQGGGQRGHGATEWHREPFDHSGSRKAAGGGRWGGSRRGSSHDVPLHREVNASVLQFIRRV